MKISPLRWLAALVAVALLLALGLVMWIAAFDLPPLHVVIDGDEVFGMDPGVLSLGDKLALAAGLLLAALVVVVVVPLASVIAAAGLAIGLVVGLGVPLLVMLLLAALFLSPLVLLGLLAWWLWRRLANRPANITA